MRRNYGRVDSKMANNQKATRLLSQLFSNAIKKLFFFYFYCLGSNFLKARGPNQSNSRKYGSRTVVVAGVVFVAARGFILLLWLLLVLL